jgi:hypothetical protein
MWKYAGKTTSNVERWRTLAEKWGRQYDVPAAILLASVQHESFGDPAAAGDVVSGAATSFGLVQFKPATAAAVINRWPELEGIIGTRTPGPNELKDPEKNLALAAGHAKDSYNMVAVAAPNASEADKWAIQYMGHMAGQGYIQAAAEKLGPSMTWDRVRAGYLDGSIKFKGKRPLNIVFYGKEGPGSPGSVDERMLTATAYGFTGRVEPTPGPTPTPTPTPPKTAGFPMWLILAAAAGLGYYLYTQKR